MDPFFFNVRHTDVVYASSRIQSWVALLAVRLSKFRVPSCIRVPKDVPYLLPKRLSEKSVTLHPPALGEVLFRPSGFLTLLRDGFPALGDPLDVNTRQEDALLAPRPSRAGLCKSRLSRTFTRLLRFRRCTSLRRTLWTSMLCCNEKCLCFGSSGTVEFQ